MKVYHVAIKDYWTGFVIMRYRAEYHGQEAYGNTPADAIVALCRYLRNNDLV
jgi:hypothetical protein